ncbi:MAG: penicillin-binding protein 2 [Patescibacteria group bacterium]
MVNGLLKPERGEIFFTDKNDTLVSVAGNKDFNVIFAVPSDVQKSAEKADLNLRDVAEKISRIVGKPADILERQLGKKDDQYEVLVKKASYEQIEKIQQLSEEMALGGFYSEKQKERYYPAGNLASHILGFVSPTNENEIKAMEQDIERGRYGLEQYFNASLTGLFGEVKKDKIISREDGKDLFLTIDRNIQSQAEEVLKKLVDKWQAASGSVIVQEPTTGKILAMANVPDFDPNNYFDFQIKNFLNPSISSLYEPGSVFKLITMAAGIDSGKITLNSTYVDNGYVILNGKKITNWNKKAYGKVNMAAIIENSINTGSVYVENKTGHEIFRDYVKLFGFNELIGISLPGEVRGNINNLNNGEKVDYATASFGQGVAITPLQMLNAVSAIANGGSLMKPLITKDEKPEIIRRVISENTAKEIIKMMVSAVKKNIISDISNYEIAGKTGTAYIPDFKKGGYSDDVINTYVGFAPATNPRFVILIKIEKPKGAPLAGQTVVPAFRELAQFILNYYNIPPDNL